MPTKGGSGKSTAMTGKKGKSGKGKPTAEEIAFKKSQAAGKKAEKAAVAAMGKGKKKK
jgi:hypothetical protein